MLAEALSNAISKNRGHSAPRIPVQAKLDGSVTPTAFSPSLPKPHLHDRHQVAHEFTGCNIVFPDPVEASRITTWLEQLPESVIRAKALLTLTSDPDCRFLHERVGMKISSNPIPVRHISKVPCSGLFIGPDLNPDELLQLTREVLHPNCHFPKP